METIQWEDHSPELVGALANLYQNDELIDCVLETEGGLVKGHKVVLASCSPYLKDIFMSYKGVKNVPLREFNYNDLKLVLRLIYFGEVDVPVVDVSSFFKTLTVLRITSLKRFVSTNFSEKSSFKNPAKKSVANCGSESNVYFKKPGEEGFSLEGTMGISDQEDLLSLSHENIDSHAYGVSKTKRISVLKQSSVGVTDCKAELRIMGTCAIDKLRVDEAQGSVEHQLSPFAFIAISPLAENFEEADKDDGLSTFERSDRNPLEGYSHDRIKEENLKKEKDLMTESRIKTEIEHEMDVCDVYFKRSKNVSITESFEDNSNSDIDSCDNDLKHSCHDVATVENTIILADRMSATQTNQNLTLDKTVGTDLSQDNNCGRTEDCDVEFESICDISEREIKEEELIEKTQNIEEHCNIPPSSQQRNVSWKYEPEEFSIFKHDEKMKETAVVVNKSGIKLKNARVVIERISLQAYNSSHLLDVVDDNGDSEKINQQPFEGSDTCENEIDVKNYSQDEHPIKLSECLESFSAEVKEHHRFTPDFVLPISSFSGIQSECNLIERVQTPFGDNQYVCNICEASFIKECGLKTHMRTHTGEKTFMCTLCGLSFSKKRSINRHMSSHMAKKTFQCRVCERSFSEKAYLKKHMRSHSDERPFICSVCETSFSLRSTLKDHMFTHTGEKPFQCSVCEKSFSRNYVLKVHMRTHTGEKSFHCSLCDASFSQKIHVRVHMSTHTGERPYKCSVCQRSFSEKANLKVHMRTHTGERPFICSVCNASFSLKSTLKKHIDTHTGRKGYACSVCDKSFSRNQFLNAHMRTHTGEKSFCCTLCDASFRQKIHLRRHMSNHTGEKLFQCSLCGRSFARNDRLKEHMRTHSR